MDTRRQIEEAIAAQELLRGSVADDVLDATLAVLRQQLEAMEEAPPRRAQRRLITVMFADVAGSTALAATMDPEEVADLFAELWDRVDRIIAGHTGRVDKHIGDAVMAVWGAGGVREDDPESAVRAALEIIGAVGDLAAAGTTGVSVRIGINTGPAFLGEVGVHAEFTAIGDTVNVAARLQHHAPEGGILISEDTLRHVRGIFSVEAQEPLRVKGKDQPLEVYVVTGLAPRSTRRTRRGIEGIDTEMVGRAAEMTALRAAFAECAASRSLRLVTVDGEAGLGKTRLAEEFVEWVRTQDRPVRLLTGRADERTMRSPHALTRDLLFTAFDIAEDDDADAAMRRLEAGMARLTGALDPRAAAVLGHILGLAALPDALADLRNEPDQLRELTYHAVAELVRPADAATTLLLLEDLHWADQTTVDLLEHVFEACRDAAVMVLATARPGLYERRPGWGETPGHARRMELHPLSAADSARLVEDALRALPSIPESIFAATVAQGDGNPYFIEELVNVLIDDGVIVTGAAQWSVAEDKIEAQRVPATLAGLLQARLDRLDSEERELLLQASVVGISFWEGALQAIQPRPEPAVERTMETLAGRNLVSIERESSFVGTQEYAFRHALLRDTAYELVLKRDRPRYHRAVAGWLVDHTDGDSRAPVIGRHFELGGDPAQAAEWYQRAGGWALDRFAISDAIELYRRALDLEALEPPGRMHALDRLGAAYMLHASYEEARTANRNMLAEARRAGDRRQEARALVGLAMVELRQGANREALTWTDQANSVLADDDADARDRSEAQRVAAWALLRLGDLDAGRRQAEQSVQTARSAGDRRGEARALNVLASLRQTTGDIAVAAELLEEALAIDRERGDRRAEASTLVNLGENARFAGNYAAAATHYREALEMQRSLGDRDMAALTLSNLGGAQVGLGEYEGAIASLEEALHATSEAGAAEYQSETHRFLAEAYLAGNDVAAATPHALRALELGRASDNPEQVGHAWRVLGSVASYGDPVTDERLDADACFERSVEVFREIGSERDGALTLGDWSHVLRRRGEARRADELRARAAQTLATLGLPQLTARLDPAPSDRMRISSREEPAW